MGLYRISLRLSRHKGPSHTQIPATTLLPPSETSLCTSNRRKPTSKSSTAHVSQEHVSCGCCLDLGDLSLMRSSIEAQQCGVPVRILLSAQVREPKTRFSFSTTFLCHVLQRRIARLVVWFGIDQVEDAMVLLALSYVVTKSASDPIPATLLQQWAIYFLPAYVVLQASLVHALL